MYNQEGDWDKRDLMRRLCHALNIAKQVVEQLASAGYRDTDEPANNIRPEKLVSETAVLLIAASSAAHASEEVRVGIDSVARLLIPHARGERMRLGVCLEPTLAFDYALAHICLRWLGYQDVDFDALLRLSLKSQTRAGRERLPHRALEQEWILKLWENRRSAPVRRRPRTVLRSVLSQPMDLITASREDIYAFTHALMYVTGFNLCRQRLPRGRATILAEAEGALSRCLDDQDYDLSGEVLLAWPLTGKSWSAAAAFGFRVLASVEDQAGFLPGPGTRLERLNKLKGDERTRYLLATAYHTAYVMGLLCAASLHPRRTPTSIRASYTTGYGKANSVLAILDADDLSTHWRDELNNLAVPERNAIAGFLLNIALHRAIKRRDFDAVARLLKLGYTLGVAGTPAASQAAEMLERLGTFASLRHLANSTRSAAAT